MKTFTFPVKQVSKNKFTFLIVSEGQQGNINKYLVYSNEFSKNAHTVWFKI